MYSLILGREDRTLPGLFWVGHRYDVCRAARLWRVPHSSRSEGWGTDAEA